MSTPDLRARTPHAASFLTPHISRNWCLPVAGALLTLLAACGGGGGGEVVTQPTRERTLVGPPQAPDVSDTCINNPSREGDAQHACYGVGYASRDDLQLRSDGNGSLLIKTLTDATVNGPGNDFGTQGRLARIRPSGERRTLDTPPFNGPFDVASDGTVWMMQTDTATLASELRAMDAQDRTRVVARFSGNSTSTPSGQLAGAYNRFAAGGDSVFLWSGDSLPTKFVQWRLDSVGASQLSDVPAPPGSAGIVRCRGDAQNSLWCLVDDRYRTPLPPNSPLAGNVQSAIELWRWSQTEGWQYRGGRTYVTLGYFKGDTLGLLVTDFSLRPDGSAVLSGGYTGSLYAIDAQGQWQVLMQRQDKSLRLLQQQGDAAQIPVDGVFGTTVLPDGQMAFIDPIANRIQRFDGTRLSVFSGESWSALSAWERLADTRLLGLFPDGQLLLSPRHALANVNPGVIGFRPETGTFDLLEDPNRNLKDFEYCNGLNGMEAYFGCQRVRSSSPQSYESMSKRGALVTLSQEAAPRIFRINGKKVEWLNSSARGTLTVNPGPADRDLDVLATDADANYLYQVGVQGYSRQDASPSSNVYRLPLSGGTWEVMAASRDEVGNLLPGQVYSQSVDISTVRNAKHIAVRADGGLWLANNSQLWLISKSGELRLLAGRERPTASTSEAAVDSTNGAAVRFGQIERLRALPDGRVLVVDSAGHAIRIVTELGQASTVVGTLNQSGSGNAQLPGYLNQPVDALVANNVLYVTEFKNPQMHRITGWLP